MPQFYLGGWADTKGMLAAIRREGPEFRGAPRNLGHQADYYTIERADGTRDTTLESEFLGHIETVAAPPIGALRAGVFPPSDEDRVIISTFMALQYTRSRAYRHSLASVRDEMSRIAEHFSVPGYELPADQEVRDELARRAALKSMVTSLKDLFVCFAARAWRLVDFARPVLLTSDEPVALYSAPDPSGPPRGVGLGTADLISFPLSASRTLFLLGPATGASKDVRVAGGADHARVANDLTLGGPWHQLFRHPDGPPFPERPPMPEHGFSAGDLGPKPRDGWWKEMPSQRPEN